MQWADIYRRLKRDREDSEAWEALQAAVRRRARRDLHARGTAAVDDAVMVTAASVAINFDKARGADTFAGFVFGHYLNVRRRTVQRTAETVPIEGYDPPSDDPAPLDWQIVEALQRCLARLSLREQRAVWLRYLEDAPSEQIAFVLGVKPGNARRIVFNGIAQLRRCLQERLAAPEGLR